MSTEAIIALSEAPATQPLRSHTALAGAELEFRKISPITTAMSHMARDQSYDVCEMAIGAFLQANAADKPLLLLPAVLAAGFHHKSLFTAPGSEITSPGELAGKRIGIRSYSQTTGLWVRGWMAEEDGVNPGDVTWVVTESSHVDGFKDPDNVELTDPPIADKLAAGAVDAAILGLSDQKPSDPLVTDADERDQAWLARHGCMPINHMVVVTKDFATNRAEVLAEIYSALAAGIDEVNALTADPGTEREPTPLRHGLANVRVAVELAAQYALEQKLISEPVADIDSLFAITGE